MKNLKDDINSGGVGNPGAGSATPPAGSATSATGNCGVGGGGSVFGAHGISPAAPPSPLPLPAP